MREKEKELKREIEKMKGGNDFRVLSFPVFDGPIVNYYFSILVIIAFSL